jgi:hypothetical protein
MRLLTATLALGLTLSAGADNEFLSTWKAPGAGPMDFTGRRVVAMLISDDTNLRVAAEEALVREVNARGANGVAAYRAIPKELLADKDAAKAWLEKTKTQGLVILRIVETDTQKVYSSVMWASGYYGSAWDYWGYGWGNVYPIGKAREEKRLTVETLLYDLSKGTPVWAAVTRTTDPTDVQSYVKELATDIVKRLEKDGVVAKRPR